MIFMASDFLFFSAALDAHPGDSGARLLESEHLRARGHPDAAGKRWMAELEKWPEYYQPNQRWCWWFSYPPEHARIGQLLKNLKLPSVFPVRAAAE